MSTRRFAVIVFVVFLFCIGLEIFYSGHIQNAMAIELVVPSNIFLSLLSILIYAVSVPIKQDWLKLKKTGIKAKAVVTTRADYPPDGKTKGLITYKFYVKNAWYHGSAYISDGNHTNLVLGDWITIIYFSDNPAKSYSMKDFSSSSRWIGGSWLFALFPLLLMMVPTFLPLLTIR